MKKCFLCFIVLWMMNLVLSAAYFSNLPYTLHQPNGDTLACLLTGDEYYHYLHDADGFTIVKNPRTGYYVYAVRENGIILPSPYVAGSVSPRSVGLVPGVRISAAEWQARRDQMTAFSKRSSPVVRDNHGVLNNLVIFIRFADDDEFGQSPVNLYNMFNAPDNLSLKNYFKAASYNQLEIESYLLPTPTGTTLLSYQDTHPRNYYCKWSEDNPDGYGDDDPDNGIYPRTEREMTLVTNAINYVRESIPGDLDLDHDNDGIVDNICFVVKGGVEDWSDLLWPHMWCLYADEVYINEKRVWNFNFQLSDDPSYFSVSVLCHEMFHTLGAPDLYHYSDSLGFAPVGAWDLMAQNGSTPQHSGAYMKFKYGQWIEDIPTITESGTYTLFPISSVTPERICYRIASENYNEFFVLEYRKKSGQFDNSIPGTGLLIYRINSLFNGNSGWNGDDVLDEIYIYRPNGTLTENGQINKANFIQTYGRTEFSYATNPRPFLSDGYISGIRIYDINVTLDSLTFKYLRPGDIDCTGDSDPMELSLFPNPASEVLNVETSVDPNLIQEAALYDLTGRKVAEISPEMQGCISVRDYAKGTYIFVVTLVDGRKINQKIVVQ